MKRSVQEIIELLVFGLIAVLIGTGLLWVVGWVIGGLGALFKLLAGLIWSLLRFVVPIAVVGAAVYALVRLLQGQRESSTTSSSTTASSSAGTTGTGPAGTGTTGPGSTTPGSTGTGTMGTGSTGPGSTGADSTGRGSTGAGTGAAGTGVSAAGPTSTPPPSTTPTSPPPPAGEATSTYAAQSASERPAGLEAPSETTDDDDGEGETEDEVRRFPPAVDGEARDASDLHAGEEHEEQEDDLRDDEERR